MSDKEKKDSIDITAGDEPPKPVRRIGTMNTTKYKMELAARDENTPGIVGTDEQVMQIAKGGGRKIFNNPLELAESLTGFEGWCMKKNVTPSFIGLSVFLNISKSTLLKYLQDSTEFSVMVVRDTITQEYIYSNVDNKAFDKYIESTYEKDKDGNSVSIKESIGRGIYYIEYKAVTFADVLSPIRSLIELSTTNRAWDMKNPAFGIFLAKNKFGETNHYTDEQTMVIEPRNPIDDMSDEAILKAAQALPDDESGTSEKREPTHSE